MLIDDWKDTQRRKVLYYRTASRYRDSDILGYFPSCKTFLKFLNVRYIGNPLGGNTFSYFKCLQHILKWKKIHIFVNKSILLYFSGGEKKRGNSNSISKLKKKSTTVSCNSGLLLWLCLFICRHTITQKYEEKKNHENWTGWSIYNGFIHAMISFVSWWFINRLTQYITILVYCTLTQYLTFPFDINHFLSN